MKRILTLSGRSPRIPYPTDDDVSYSEELVEILLTEFTREGDIVLDPFAGFGTTLIVAERMGRKPFGLELLPERVAFIRQQMRAGDAVLEADARKLADLELPRIDFTLTSPPYMNMVDHPQNPLTGYRSLDADYGRYLDEISKIFEAIARRMRAQAYAVVNAANLQTGSVVTPLAWDIARAISPHLRFEREVIIDAAHSENVTQEYCLIFQKV